MQNFEDLYKLTDQELEKISKIRSIQTANENLRRNNSYFYKFIDIAPKIFIPFITLILSLILGCISSWKNIHDISVSSNRKYQELRQSIPWYTPSMLFVRWCFLCNDEALRETFPGKSSAPIVSNDSIITQTKEPTTSGSNGGSIQKPNDPNETTMSEKIQGWIAIGFEGENSNTLAQNKGDPLLIPNENESRKLLDDCNEKLPCLTTTSVNIRPKAADWTSVLSIATMNTEVELLGLKYLKFQGTKQVWALVRIK